MQDGEQYENDDQVYVEQLDDGEYIEEEHEMTLDEFYAQAQKQLLANGLNSKENVNAIQEIFPRLIGRGLSQQNIEDIMNWHKQGVS